MDRLTTTPEQDSEARGFRIGDRVRSRHNETGVVELFEDPRVVVKLDADICCSRHAYLPEHLTLIGDNRWK